MTSEAVIIGIGRAGCQIVSQLETNYDKLYIDTDKEVIEKYNGVRISCKLIKEYPAMNSVEGELSVVENQNIIIETVKSYKKVIIITLLGGATSNGATKRIVDLCLSLKQDINVFASLPFVFEGNRRNVDALQTWSYTSELCSVKIIDNNYNFEKGKNTKLSDFFKLQDQKLISLIKESIYE